MTNGSKLQPHLQGYDRASEETSYQKYAGLIPRSFPRKAAVGGGCRAKQLCCRSPAVLFPLFILIGLFIIGCSTAYKSITAQMPDLSQINDGVYRGYYDLSGTPVKVTLDVTLRDNRIVNIEIIEHLRSPIGKKAENIIGQIIESQSLGIDAVSGATASSKAILKAVENAFQ